MMDRDKLKSTGEVHRSRAPRGGRAEGKGKESKVSEALGTAGVQVVLGERSLIPGALRFGDVKLIEQRFGAVGTFLTQVTELRAEAIGFLIWLSLRKAAPELTEEELDELLPARQDQLLVVLQQVLSASGLVEESGDGEGNPEPAAAA